MTVDDVLDGGFYLLRGCAIEFDAAILEIVVGGLIVNPVASYFGPIDFLSCLRIELDDQTVAATRVLFCSDSEARPTVI
jgi:hypothetical protein